MYSKLYDIYNKNLKKLCFLTSDYTLRFFFNHDKINYEEMTSLLEMNIDKCTDIFIKYNIDTIFNWNNKEENNNIQENNILVYQKPNKKIIDTLKFEFHSDIYNIVYIQLLQVNVANFLQYMIENNNINSKLKPIQVVAFNQLINFVPTFIGLGFYIKIILNNSSNEYNNNLSYDIQKKALCMSILKSYNNDSKKLFKLTIDFLLTLFSIEKKFSEEEMSYFLNTDLINVSKVYEKYDITTIIQKWN
jgi:regulator of sigma D